MNDIWDDLVPYYTAHQLYPTARTLPMWCLMECLVQRVQTQRFVIGEKYLTCSQPPKKVQFLWRAKDGREEKRLTFERRVDFSTANFSKVQQNALLRRIKTSLRKAEIVSYSSGPGVSCPGVDVARIILMRNRRLLEAV